MSFKSNFNTFSGYVYSNAYINKKGAYSEAVKAKRINPRYIMSIRICFVWNREIMHKNIFLRNVEVEFYV